MKAPGLPSIVAAVIIGSSVVFATPVNNNEPRSPQPITVNLQSRAKKPKPEDVKLKAWIDRGQDVQVSFCLHLTKCPQSSL